MHASTPLILRKSRMRRRASTDLCGGRSAMVVPTATVIQNVRPRHYFRLADHPGIIAAHVGQVEFNRDSDLIRRRTNLEGSSPFEGPARGSCSSGASVFQVIRGLLIGLLGLGLGVGVRSEPCDRLAKVHGAGAGYFRKAKVTGTGAVNL